MDTSEQYIKMCDCPEIQKQRNFEKERYYQEGDYTATKNEGILCMGSYGVEPLDGVWLPTQSQLQEMVSDGYLWQLNFNYIRWLCDEPYDGHIRHENIGFTSMEQLWLAFVMKEKYSKTWNGSTWA